MEVPHFYSLIKHYSKASERQKSVEDKICRILSFWELNERHK